ncbi:hypothetical protein Scani_04220 [Streptomyces caniferus]|uniref:Uncharacterized protein n=1 Tax=Streptomyces caniferus TaxID=285557 RepID=A0A640RZH0_9ACTN|nr:hypothetical protein Scani_04220 [Streptomyces caniferus]
MSPELSARIPGGRPGSERAGFGSSESDVASSIGGRCACCGSNRLWEWLCAVMVALSAVVVTSAPLEMFSLVSQR